jgi:flagellar hook-length control protein FliK
LALQAAGTLASNPAAQPAASAPSDAQSDTQDSDGFAALVAKLNPKTNAQPAQKTNSSGNDIAAAMAAMQNVIPLPTPSAAGKPFAALRAVDPAKLAETPNAQTPPAKPGTPTLPVMPAPGGADEDADSTDDATALPKGAAVKPADAAAQAAAAQHLLRPAPPAQTTQAQALPARFDGKADSQNGGANADTSGQSSQDGSQNGPPNHGAPAQPVTHAPNAVAQAAPVQPAVPNAASLAANNAAVGAVTSATSIQPASATLHVAPATQAASTQQPDIAALAVTIAAKSADGTKHFDIRLDPPEFGRIDVHMSVDDAGKAQAHLTADKPQTLELLQRDSGTLKSALKDSGVDVGNSGLQFSLRGQERQGGEDQPNSRGRALAVTAAIAAPTASTWSLAPDSARLDIRV